MFTAMDGWMRATGPGTRVAMARGTSGAGIVDGWLEIDKERIYNYLYLCGHTVLTQGDKLSRNRYTAKSIQTVSDLFKFCIEVVNTDRYLIFGQ